MSARDTDASTKTKEPFDAEEFVSPERPPRARVRFDAETDADGSPADAVSDDSDSCASPAAKFGEILNESLAPHVASSRIAMMDDGERHANIKACFDRVEVTLLEERQRVTGQPWRDAYAFVREAGLTLGDVLASASEETQDYLVDVLRPQICDG